MNQLATIPIWIWSLWTLGIILIALAILVFRKVNRSIGNREAGSILPLVRRASYLAAWGILIGSSGLIFYTFHLEDERIKQAINQDPALSRMASNAEAQGWMDEEVNPLILDLDSATERLERAERQKASAVAEVEKIRAKLKEKEREFEQRFGKLKVAEGLGEKPKLDYQQSQPPAYVHKMEY